MERLEIKAKTFLGTTNTNKEGMCVLINYKYTDKKLTLTQKLITDTFLNLPFVLYLILYSMDTFFASKLQG